MAFPTTGILDNFNRAAEDPLSDGGKWSNPLLSGQGSLEVTSANQCAELDVNNGSAYRSNQTYGPDTEAFITASTVGANDEDASLYLRIRQVGAGTMDAYVLSAAKLAGTDEWTFSRVDNEVFTVLGAVITQEYSNGDSIGYEAIGSTLTAYYLPSGGSWSALGNRTDGTYPDAGFIGLEIRLSTFRFDDFGGGTVVMQEISATEAFAASMTEGIAGFLVSIDVTGDE